jgi:hypothetical protein
MPEEGERGLKRGYCNFKEGGVDRKSRDMIKCRGWAKEMQFG